MTRKDTILIAVVINAGLLAILFMTAVIYDTDKVLDSTELENSLVENKENPPESAAKIIAMAPTTGDEVDNVLKYYSAKQEVQEEVKPPPPPQPQITKKEPETVVEPIYHVVKSGDNPWKIAKHYNVKYDDILRLNQLDETKARNLKIGDRIRVK